MQDQIKTITERSDIEGILNKYFLKNDVFLKTSQGNVKIIFKRVYDNGAAFTASNIKKLTGGSVIFARHDNNTFNALAVFKGKDEEDDLLFEINKIQIILQARGNDRKSLESQNGYQKNIIYITNLISDSIILNSLTLEAKKIDRIRESVLNEMSQAFNYIKINFLNQKKSDSRMIYFLKNKEPIYILDTNDTKNNSPAFRYYLSNIFARDTTLQGRKDLISEISLPLLYKMKLPYGYLQVNNTTQCTNSMYQIVKKFAALIDQMMIKANIFPSSEDKLVVSNVSKNGLALVFKERKFIRYFKEDSLIHFEMHLPDNKTIQIMARVRNISLMENNIIMIGCSLEEIDALSEVLYEEFVDSVTAAP